MVLQSKKIFFFISIIEFLNINYIFANSFITIPFSFINKQSGSSSPNTTTTKDYFESLINYPIYTTIKMNNKDIKFHLTLERYATYLSEKTYKEINSQKDNFDIDEDNDNLYSLDYIGINLAKLKMSNFSFLYNNEDNLIINNYSFFMTTKINNSTKYDIKETYITEPEEIGLNIIKGNKYNKVDVEEYNPYWDWDYYNPGETKVLKNNGYNIEEKTNLINQLKSYNYISSYTFSIKFDENEEKGKIFIGGYPHEIDKEHYNEKYFIYDNVEVGYFRYYYHYEFKDIIYDKEKLPWVKEVEFSINFGFILSAYNYRDYLNEIFFNNENYSKFCQEEIIGEYWVKACKEKVIKYFKPIYFYLSNTYLESNQTNYIYFDYKDLFKKAPGNNDLYYFQIIFVDNSYKWVFGRPLFKKYRTVFDQDKKIIGFYTETGEYTNKKDDNDNDNDNNGNKFSLVWIFIVLLFIFVVLVIIGFLLYKNLTSGRKKIKANELDDDYDYSPDKDLTKKKEDNLLINE